MDADDTDCQSKTWMKTDFFNVCYYTAFLNLVTNSRISEVLLAKYLNNLANFTNKTPNL